MNKLTFEPYVVAWSWNTFQYYIGMAILFQWIHVASDLMCLGLVQLYNVLDIEILSYQG